MMKNIVNFPITLSAQWQLPNDANLSQLSENITDWLLDEGSLTARLKSHCDDFKVQVIGEQQQLCSAAEAGKLINIGEPVLVREVLLYCDNIPQVFARSLIPLKSLTGKEVALAQLGDKPLGQVLFNDPSLQRQQLEISCFNCASSVGILAKDLCKKSVSEKELQGIKDKLWGRRSVFLLAGKPLVVAEVFLPGAFAYQKYASY